MSETEHSLSVDACIGSVSSVCSCGWRDLKWFPTALTVGAFDRYEVRNN